MEWFTGDVTQALKKYQEINGIIIVYIHHSAETNNEHTIKFDELWSTFDKSILDGVPNVAIRMTSDSQDAKQFSQFFPTPVFPVCYVIGLNGQPLEVITPVEPLTTSRLNESLKKSLGHYRDQLKDISGSTINSEVAAPSETTDTNTAAAVAASGTDVSTLEQAEALAERLRHARELLEKKRKEKEEEDRQKEVERRNDGKMMLDAREKQKERELKEAVEKRRREKEEDARALKQLREQIKKDKEERARKAAGKLAEEDAPKASKPEPVINKPVDTEECRIQCRFPDGKTLVNTFPSKGPLQAVVDAVNNDGRLSGEFMLVQTVPRRQLTDLSKTLFELGLTPASSLLVVPKEGRLLLKSGTRAGYFQMLFGFLYIFYAPFAALFNYFGIGGRAVANTPANDRPAQPPAAGGSGAVQNDETTGDNNGARRMGRLHDDSGENSSDTEPTWNGNSTQQL